MFGELIPEHCRTLQITALRYMETIFIICLDLQAVNFQLPRFFFKIFIYLFILAVSWSMQDLFLKFYLFIYFWLRWDVAARSLSLVAASGGYSSLGSTGFSLRWLLLLRSMGSRRVGFSICGTWA